MLGSGSTLPEDLKRIPEDAVKVSINIRPLSLLECDYVVFFDHHCLMVDGQLIETKAEIIAPFKEFSDYIIEDHVWFKERSATTACYLACYMGCDPVILMGMDCYTGEKRYFDDSEDPNIDAWAGLTDHTRVALFSVWGEAKAKCPNSEVIRSIGMPLNQIFEEYNESRA